MLAYFYIMRVLLLALVSAEYIVNFLFLVYECIAYHSILFLCLNVTVSTNAGIIRDEWIHE